MHHGYLKKITQGVESDPPPKKIKFFCFYCCHLSDSSLQDANKHENQIQSPTVWIPQQLQQLEYWSSYKYAVDTTQKGVGGSLWGALELIGKSEEQSLTMRGSSLLHPF